LRLGLTERVGQKDIKFFPNLMFGKRKSLSIADSFSPPGQGKAG